MDGVHDLGGVDGFGSVVEPGGDAVFHAAWEKRVFALHILTGEYGLRAGSGRAQREQMPPASYLEASYYERWLYSAEQGLVAGGTITTAEVDAWQARIAAGEPIVRRYNAAKAAAVPALLAIEEPLGEAGEARFRVGDEVRVRRMRPRKHHRCPRYLRGATGRVERIQGTDNLPLNGPTEPVYCVSFASAAVFGATEEPPFTVRVDLWESYLEPASD